MKHTCIAMLVIAVALLLPVSLCGSERIELVEIYDEGSVNWSQGVIVARGIGMPPDKKAEETQVGGQALTIAQEQGWHNILATAKRVRIASTYTVGDLSAKDNQINTKLESMARNAKVVKQEYLSDGTVEITLEMSLYGGFAQLMLPLEIKQIETIKAVNVKKNPNKEQSSKSIPIQASQVFTGLVVDARGLPVVPALAPIVLDETGQAVYGPEIISREFAVQEGGSGYVRDLKAAQSSRRVSNNPLTVKGLRIQGGIQANIVISNADAAKLRSSFEHLKFLKACKVIIVVD
jgi:hypothetical protein